MRFTRRALWTAVAVPALLAGCVNLRPPLNLPKPEMPAAYLETVPPEAIATPEIPGGTAGMAPPKLNSPEVNRSPIVTPQGPLQLQLPGAPLTPPVPGNSAGAQPGIAATPAVFTMPDTGPGHPGSYPGMAPPPPVQPVSATVVSGPVAAATAAAPASPPGTMSNAYPPPARQADQAPPGGPKPPDPWWHAYGSDELDRLVQQALDNNHDLKAAMHRVREAQAQAGENATSLLPNLQVAGLSQVQSPVGGPGSVVTSTINGSSQRLYTIGLIGSYEIDLWGKNRDSQEAALANAQAVVYTRDTVAMTLIANVITTYFSYLGANDRVQVASRNVDNMNRVLQTVNDRYRIGEGTRVEIEQQATALAQARATVSPLTLLREQQVFTLAALIGVNPGGLHLTGITLNGIKLPKPPMSLPSDILTQRPDIRSAEASIVQANATIGVGKAKLLPSFSISGQEGMGSNYLDTVLDPGHWYYLFAANAAQTIFDYGKTLAEIEFDKATYDERVEIYRQAVLNALRDVEQALAGMRLSADTEAAQLDAWNHARAAYQLTQEAFRLGTSDYLTILDTERTQYTSEDNVVQARLQRLDASVGLFRGLGGAAAIPPDEATPPLAIPAAAPAAAPSTGPSAGPSIGGAAK